MFEQRPLNSNSEAALRELIDPLTEAILRLEATSAEIRLDYQHWLDVLVGELKNQSEGWMFSLRNKFGFTKKEAEKLFFDYKKKDEEPDDPKKPEHSSRQVPGSGGEPKSTDEKISLIMDYMKETSVKLDRIEDDIALLKNQVEAILQKI